ncbi:DUF5361 domain-containing protein [Dermabacteraceae bacterium P13077]
MSQAPRDSALWRHFNSDEEQQWGIAEHLAAIIADAARTLVWMQSEDGRKNRNRPEPIQRPGVEETKKVQVGSDALDADEMCEWLGGAFAQK